MDDTLLTDQAAGTVSEADAAQLTTTSSSFVGRWHRLVSTTNWEKGRIISQWRTALREAGADAGLYTDEAWSQQVGGVSSQHVGRLRRVFERFGAVVPDYPGLFWSHFCAALDWNDAEMWLEGAVQNRWSVAGMRQQRSTTLGEVAQSADHAPDAEAEPLDEDAEAGLNAEPTDAVASSHREFFPSGPLPEGPDFGEEEAREPESAAGEARPMEWDEGAGGQTAAAPVRPFAALAELPDDLAEACEALKLAILRHKLDGWRQTAAADVLGYLDALHQLILAP